ncbi:Bacterial transcription activator, effector binding domain [compost metagenome]
MLLKIAIAVIVVLVIFLGYVSTREGQFRYERSGVIAAPPEKIFPYLSNLKNGDKWSPYEKVDPNMKKTFAGNDGEVGSTMVFEGNKDAGSGKLEILKIVPNELVEIKLTMTAPMHAENIVEYRLTPEANGTKFSWSMSGDGGFMGKLVNVFIDVEKMVADQFSEGIANLKAHVEGPTSGAAAKMDLTEKPETVQWPETHYVYVEEVGPFEKTAFKTWGEVHQQLAEISKHSKVLGTMALYKISPEMIYRAGVKVDAEPKTLPPGFKYIKFEGGKYARFTLKGSYSQLGEASGKVHSIVAETKMPVRDGFFIEHYANDPKTTAEKDLITEILIPIK